MLKKKVIAVRSHYPDIRLEKEMESLSIMYDVKIIGWNRGRLKDINFLRKEDVIFWQDVEPGSIKVPLFLPFWWIFVLINLLKEHFDVIHAVDFDSYLPSLIISKLKKKPIIYDIYDFYGETIEFPIFKKMFQNFFVKIDKFLIKFANAIIIVDDARIQQIGINNKIIISVYNSPDISNLPINNNINLNFSKDDFVIFFGGILLEDRGIDLVINAVKELNDEKIKLILMGYPGNVKFGTKIREMCENVSNIFLQLEMVPHSQILDYTSKVDTIFILYDPNIPNNVYASPNKLFEAMCFSKPVIVSDKSSMTNIVKKEKCGVIVTYGDIDEIKKAIIMLKSNPSLSINYGNMGKLAFDTKYNWSIMKQKLLDLYNDILTSKTDFKKTQKKVQ